MEKLLIVTDPVADLRRKPIDAAPDYTHDELQETQVLYNEILIYRDENGGWYYVEAIEQNKFTRNNIWQGYPGWVRKRSVIFIDKPPKYNIVVKNKAARILSYPRKGGEPLLIVSAGTRFKVKEKASPHNRYFCVELTDGKDGWVMKGDVNRMPGRSSKKRCRENIVNIARLFLGVPYLWGGRSMCFPELYSRESGIKRGAWSVERRVQTKSSSLTAIRYPLSAVITGVDCSGLINLVYRVNNIDIPRDAHEQWMVAKKMPSERLEPGDLIFVFAEGEIDSINHVMMYLDGEQFIEASETGGVVRINTFKEKFGVNMSKLTRQDFIIDKRKIYFGTVLRNE